MMHVNTCRMKVESTRTHPKSVFFAFFLKNIDNVGNQYPVGMKERNCAFHTETFTCTLKEKWGSQSSVIRDS